MGKLTVVDRNWEHLYTQFKNPAGDPVMCMIHKVPKKFVYFDLKSNRLLTKQEAVTYRADVTGIHVSYK